MTTTQTTIPSSAGVQRKTALMGELQVPGDKSISHRTLMFSALSTGKSRIEGLLESADVLSTQACLQQVGIHIEVSQPGKPSGQDRTVTGLNRFQEPKDILDCGNSGTTIRLLTGLLAPQIGYGVLTGDDSLKRRPMGRVIQPLRQMGAQIVARENNTLAPLSILPLHTPLQGMTYTLPVASAQVKSAILLAGLFAEGDTKVIEPSACRDHTEQMLQSMGVKIQRTPLTAEIASEMNSGKASGFKTTLSPLSALPHPMSQGYDWHVPGDFSSASFWLVAGTLVPGSCITLKGVNLNPTRTGLMHLLVKAGADITVENERQQCGEPAGDITVRSAALSGNLVVDDSILPTLIDEIPILAVAGLYLNGTLNVKEADELRKKESDRIQTVAHGFSALGAKIEETPDGFILNGEPERTLHAPKTPLHTGHDHRLAMAFSLLNRIHNARCQQAEYWAIDDPACVAVSYPNFFDHLQQLSQ